MINKNNLHKNKAYLDYQYQIGDLVTIYKDYLKVTKKASLANNRPYWVIKVYNNETIRIFCEDAEETINIHYIDPFFEHSSTLD